MFPSDPVEFGWLVSVGGGAVAQLPGVISSPGVEVAVRADRCGMKPAEAGLFPGESVGGSLGLADQAWSVGGRDVRVPAQLAVAISSPGVEVAVRADGCGMPSA